MWMLLQRIKMQKSKTAYEAALHLLKYRGQSTYELRKKLKDREYPLREIEEALSKLLHYGYVNDWILLKICLTYIRARMLMEMFIFIKNEIARPFHRPTFDF